MGSHAPSGPRARKLPLLSDVGAGASSFGNPTKCSHEQPWGVISSTERTVQDPITEEVLAPQMTAALDLSEAAKTYQPWDHHPISYRAVATMHSVDTLVESSGR